ncbi:ankyrin repeat family protein [Zea mays]|uniref:Ankyrin repeat family protein n=1 Tax=Zea mays TaxID=4577 RepID=A0A1D6QVJ2_MAIZE|nr:ankyrin repeat family protein [Zea mays]
MMARKAKETTVEIKPKIHPKSQVKEATSLNSASLAGPQSAGSQVKEATSLNSASLAGPQSAGVSSSAKGDSMEANLRGYDAYKNENYIGAVDAYTQAIDLDPSNATLWSNKSLCWLLLGMAETALEDAKQSRTLRPDSGIACYREGAALHELQVWGFTTRGREGSLLKDLKYCVFGLGNTQYEHFNKVAKMVHELLQEQGGKRLVPVGLALETMMSASRISPHGMKATIMQSGCIPSPGRHYAI